MNRHNSGFSLAELLVAMSIAVFIGLIVTTSLTGTFSAWTHIEARSAAEICAVKTISDLERDIASSLSIYQTAFEGNETSISFSILSKQNLFSAAYPGIVSWIYNPTDFSLTRSLKRFPLADDAAEITEIYKPITSVSFTYLDDSLAQSGGVSWQNQWLTPGTNIYPKAVLVVINGFSRPVMIMSSINTDLRENTSK